MEPIRESRPVTVLQPLSAAGAPRNWGWNWKPALALLLAASGGGIFCGVFLTPIEKVIRASSWPESTCTILQSTVQTQGSGRSPTYDPEILYTYRVAGVPYKSDTYGFLDGAPSDYSASRQLVNRYPPGSTVGCYVNPNDPHEAVLYRDLSSTFLLALLPLGMFLAGMFVFFHSMRATYEVAHPVSGAVILRPKTSSAMRLSGVSLICLFWNGIVFILLASMIHAWKLGSPDWFLAVFLLPFLLVGLGLAAGAYYQFVALFEPRATLRIGTASFKPGDKTGFEWQLKGRCDAVRRLRIYLEGLEETSRTDRVDSYTKKKVLYSSLLVDRNSRPDVVRGIGQLAIPADMKLARKGSSNRIVWRLRLSADVENFPNVDEEYPLTVEP